MTVRSTTTLGFAGDFCLAAVRRHGERYIDEVLEFTQRLTEEADWSMANLEFCICHDNPSSSRMGVEERHCTNLGSSGFNAFCLANNHIRDCGSNALLNTVRVLTGQGVQTVGAAENLASATKPIEVSLPNVRLAVIAVTDATQYTADGSRAGVAPIRRRRVLKQIAELAAQYDLVVVNVHADLEFANHPAPWKVRFSRALVNAGANVVIHHHPHTLQGIEYYKGALIAYSLGNLVFPLTDNVYMSNRPGHVDHGAFLLVDVSFDRNNGLQLSHRIIPVELREHDRSYIAQGNMALQILEDVERYSRELLNPTLLRKAHFRRCAQATKHYLMSLYYAAATRRATAFWARAVHPLKTRMARQGLTGFFSGGLL